MTCYCIGRNYAEHAAELGNAVPDKPLIFAKPSTALLQDGKPFELPDFSQDVHYETELVLRVSKRAQRIDAAEAWNYVDALTIGVDLTARDLQNALKAKGQPWEIAKGFDASAPIGRFVPVPQALKFGGIAFEGRINGASVQQGHTRDMIFPVPAFMAYLTRFFTLMPGDLLFTGTPAGVGPLRAGDHFEGWLLEDETMQSAEKASEKQQKLLDFEILGHGER
ncbi:MAG: 2-hydroxyhepta-2,4-diene-1,7-dioate isomerase [Bacteroidetes bacterium]|nr:2-hydroxyhepta-2,4-diene-1,7-dioate isomerase [Bacteroidota bacterium]